MAGLNLTVNSTDEHFYQKFLFNESAYGLYNWYNTGALLNSGELNQINFPARNEIWFRCSIYANWGYETKFFIGNENNASGFLLKDVLEYGNINSKLLINGTEISLTYDNYCSDDDGYNVHLLLHLKSGANDGIVDAKYASIYHADEHDDNVISQAVSTGNVNNGQLLTTLFFIMQKVDLDNAEYNIKIGNIAISDQALDILGALIPDTSIKTFNYDIQRDVVHNINLNFDIRVFLFCTVTFEAERIINRSEKFNCDTVRQLPHRLIITPSENGVFTDAINTTGVSNIEIELAAQQLTDRLTYVSTNPIKVLQKITGQYLDYKFSMIAEQVKITELNIHTGVCCTDLDKILYTQFSFGIPTPHGTMTQDEYNHWLDKYDEWLEEHFPDIEDRADFNKASTRMKLIAEVLDTNLVMQFDDFVSTADIKQEGYTYTNFISELFGWTSRAPSLMINCYIRDDTIFVIQRGHETNIVDLTNAKIANKVKSEKLLRLAWGSNTESYSITVTEPVYSDYDFTRKIGAVRDEDEDKDEASGDGKNQYDNNGLVLCTVIEEGDTRTVINYSYVQLANGKMYLTSEVHDNYEKDEHNEWKYVDSKTITHTILNAGVAGQVRTTAKDTETNDYEGSVVSFAIEPYDQRLSAYAKYRIVRDDDTGMLKEQELTDVQEKEVTINGIATVDTSLPVEDFETKKRFSDAINWLNRKNEEKISMDVYDYPHVIDFNDKIIFEGNDYHLESNTVVKTPRIINKQSIQIVRWHGLGD